MRAAGLLVPLTGGIQVLAQVPGTVPGLDEFRVERVVQFPGQHLLFFGSHRTYLLVFRFAAAFAASCFTRSFTIRSIRSKGIGSSSGN